MATPAPRHPHLVFVGRQESKGPSRIYISVDKISASTDACDWYYPKLSPNRLVTRKGFTPRFIIAELGWFDNPINFGLVCEEIPIEPVPHMEPDQNKTLEWKGKLIDRLNEFHGGSWNVNEDITLS